MNPLSSSCVGASSHQGRSAACEAMEPRMLLAAGTPDLTFSGDGQTVLSFPGAAFTIVDTALQSDGKVIVGGTKGSNMALARLHADGSLDTTFGSGGLFESNRREQLTSLAVQSDGKIVIGLGGTGDFEVDLIVGRILADGAGFDSTFGDFGITSVGDRWERSNVTDVAVQRDGKIIAAGSRLTGLLVNSDFAIARYNDSGAPDPAFDGDGVAVASFGGIADTVQAVIVDYTGNSATNPYYGTIVAVGGNGNLRPDRFQILRLRPDGTPDASFDSDGKLTSPDLSGAGIEAAIDVVVQPGGKIVVAGTAASASDPNVRNFLVARYTLTGSLDTTFGLSNTGITELDLGGHDEVGAIAVGYLGTANNVSAADNVIVSGSRNGLFAAVALRGDGQLDNRFSGDGILTTSIPGHAAGLFATGDLYPPARKLVFAGGAGQVARFWDVGPVISVGTFQPNMHEQGQVGTSFIVGIDVPLPYPLTVFLSTGGQATPPNTLPPQPSDYFETITNPPSPPLILFGNGQTSSTSVTIPAGSTFVTVALTPVDDTTIEGDEVATFTVGTTVAYDASATKSATLVIRDNDTTGGPVVTASGFNYETSPLNATITFSQSVVTSFTIGDLVITGPGGTSPAYLLNYNNVINTGTVVFYNGLGDGNYTVRVKSAGVTNAVGQPMAADHVFSFFVLAGDTDRDRDVDFFDFLTLRSNYGKMNQLFSDGDSNYDGDVDFFDFLILRGNYGVTLPPPGGSLFARGGDAGDEDDGGGRRG